MIDVERELRAGAPNLLREPAPFGMFAGAGWLPLLRETLTKLERIAEKLPANERPKILGAKQKFGELRLSISGGNEECRLVADEAECLSNLVCEDCSLPGELRTGSYLRTLCAGCYVARGTF